VVRLTDGEESYDFNWKKGAKATKPPPVTVEKERGEDKPVVIQTEKEILIIAYYVGGEKRGKRSGASTYF